MTAAHLAKVRLLLLNDGATQEQACAEVGISDRAFRTHRETNTQVWKDANALFQQVVDENLVGVAKGRLMRILDHGNDGAAAVLIKAVLGLSDKHELTGKEGKDLFGDWTEAEADAYTRQIARQLALTGDVPKRRKPRAAGEQHSVGAPEPAN